jgi:hypothetical protein
MKGEVLAKVQVEGFLHVRFLRRVTRHKTMRICSSYVVVVAQIWSCSHRLGAPLDSVTSLTVSSFLRILACLCDILNPTTTHKLLHCENKSILNFEENVVVILQVLKRRDDVFEMETRNPSDMRGGSLPTILFEIKGG